MYSKTEKRQLIIFVLTAYGIPYLLGLLMWYGYGKQVNLGAFPNAQMMYPAMGVMLAFPFTRKEDRNIPRVFYWCFILITAVHIVLTILSVVMPEMTIKMPGGTVPMWILVIQYVQIAGSVLGLICLLISGKARRRAYGMGWKNWKASVFCILLGLLPLNFVFGYIAFFGEEYGWRYYLQPFLQKRFGLRKGVLLLGLVWGIWHLPLDGVLFGLFILAKPYREINT